MTLAIPPNRVMSRRARRQGRRALEPKSAAGGAVAVAQSRSCDSASGQFARVMAVRLLGDVHAAGRGWRLAAAARSLAGSPEASPPAEPTPSPPTAEAAPIGAPAINAAPIATAANPSTVVLS